MVTTTATPKRISKKGQKALPAYVADPGLKDFRNFLYLLWKYLNLPTPTVSQYAIADQIQHGPDRQIVEAFRGVGKSWITVGYALHTLYLDPQKKIEVVSASKSLADNFSTFCLQLIYGWDLLAPLRPEGDQRNSKIQFDVGPAKESKDPSLKSVGITGQITGTRADLIIADDIEVPNNSLTQTGRDKLAESVKEFDAVIKPGGRILYLGTPQTEMSIYNILQERGYKACIWPAKYPSRTEIIKYGDRLAPNILEEVTKEPWKAGRSTEPSRFSDEDLAIREASYGKSGFALQFMLDTTLSDALKYPLKLSDLIVMDLDSTTGPEKVIWASGPQQVIGDLPCVGFKGDRYHRPMEILGTWMPYQGTVMFIDPSGRGSNETGYAIVSMIHGTLFLRASGGLTGGYTPENLTFLCNLAKEHKVTWIRTESNFGDGMFNSLLTPILTKVYPCTLDEVRSTTNKERRIIDTLEPVMNQHRLVVDSKVVKADYEGTVGAVISSTSHQYQLFYQMSRITKDRGALAMDDRLDALAGAVAYWTERLATDQDRQMEEHKDALLMKELTSFIDHTFNTGRDQGSTSLTWTSPRGR